ncbi:MAG TPA: peptidylprolyl isomerase [Thermoanaerobaculia bacterium]
MLVFALLLAAAAVAGAEGPQVVLETSKGTIVAELYPDKAPLSVENFLGYVESGFFDGTVFHRVIDGFMIQGGGFTADLERKLTREAIQNESKNGVSNARGTLAMARTNDPHSATAQFYVNLVDNDNLDSRGGGWGYAVFGKVVEGMDVVDAIAKVPTGRQMGMGDVPTEAVVITKATVKKAADAE